MVHLRPCPSVPRASFRKPPVVKLLPNDARPPARGEASSLPSGSFTSGGKGVLRFLRFLRFLRKAGDGRLSEGSAPSASVGVYPLSRPSGRRASFVRIPTSFGGRRYGGIPWQ